MSTVLNDSIESQSPMGVDFEDLTDEQKAAFVELNSGTHTKVMAKQYLDSTDWYVTRYIETGKAIPENIESARAQARIDASENQ